MSEVWKHSKIETEASPTASCNVCKADVPRGGKNRASFNTTNLIRHLRNNHKQQHSEYIAAKEAATTTLKQPTLSETLKRKEKLPENCERAKKITAKIAEFIALDDQPLSVTENVGFRRLIEHLEPRYQLPSRHYFTEKALPALHTKLRGHLQAMLTGVPSLSFTTDIWSSSVSPMSLISFTVQWIDSEFNLQHATLHAQNFRGSHTADRVREALQGMLTSWGIEKSRVHVILRDNARNMKKAMDDMEVTSVGCLAHTLQLAVHEGLLSQRSVTDALGHREENYWPFQTFPVGLFPSGRCPERPEDGRQASTAGRCCEMEQQPLHVAEHLGAKAGSLCLCS